MTEMEVQDDLLKEKIIVWEKVHDNIKELLLDGEKVCKQAKQLQEIMGTAREQLEDVVEQIGICKAFIEAVKKHNHISHSNGKKHGMN